MIIGEVIFAQFAQVMFAGLLGVVFAYLVSSLLTSENYLLKGWFYGGGTWFFIYAVTFLFKVPELAIITLQTSISNFIGASVYGLVLVEVLRRLETRVK